MSNLADLWLREGHLENMLSSGAQPLVQSLPWQLMQHAVASPAGGPLEVGLAEHHGSPAEHKLSMHCDGTSGWHSMCPAQLVTQSAQTSSRLASCSQ